MNLNDLLQSKQIDPKHVLVLRHRPSEPQLNKVLPWLAAEKPDTFNAYQQTQGPKLEGAMHKMEGTGYIASFIGREAGKAVFVGLYTIDKSKTLTHEKFWQIPAYKELKAFGLKGIKAEKQPEFLWFDLTLTDFYAEWKGKLIVNWPPPELAWWRKAPNNEFKILSILEESAFDAAMPQWDTIDLTWEELKVLPKPWKSALAQWRGIYYIFDTSDGKGYVFHHYTGSAYGADNILGRWLNYAATGDGGNKLLKKRDANKFRFSILQRVSPDMEAGDVIRLESTWKERLHTRHPYGLNDN